MSTTIASMINSNVQPLNTSNTINDALQNMHNNSISSVVITNEDNKPVGIFTDHDSLKIIYQKLDKDMTLDNVMSSDVFYIKNSTYIHDAYMLMENKSFRHLIVVDEDEQYLGVISEGDFIRHLSFDEELDTQVIEEVMNSYILTVSKDASLDKVTKQMTEHKQNYMVILDNNIPVSVLSERDITHFCLECDKPMDKILAYDIIQKKNFYTIYKDTSLQKAAHMMEGHNIHQVLVIDKNEELIGLVTRHDVLKAMHGAYFDFLFRTLEIKNKNEQVLLEQKHNLWLIANHDQLTNLPNRYQLRDYIEDSVTNNNQNNQISVILVDLKKFKDINDSYGHDIGDEVLNIIANKLLKFSNKDSMVARLGNNEFAIAINNLKDIKQLQTITKNILDELLSLSTLSNGININISSSIGVSMYPENTKDAKDLLLNAGTALHEAKKEDFSTIKFYNIEMTKNIQKRTSYEFRLKDAIKNNELELYYQPQVHIQTNNIVGVEALLRWNDKIDGVISPEVFIPIAEESGLINPIGEWVIQEACKFGKTCLDNGHRFTIAVNVSANQIKYQNITDIVSKALHTTGFSAEKLEIEITESSIMQRAEETVKTLHNIRALGVRIAIDDFGTGYSSLSYLKKFPIDVLKIDKSFIDDIPYSKDDMAIVVAIIEMGKALGYEVLAEGIETLEQLKFLEEKECSLYQGFYKSKPLKADEFEEFLSKEQAQN